MSETHMRLILRILSREKKEKTREFNGDKNKNPQPVKLVLSLVWLCHHHCEMWVLRCLLYLFNLNFVSLYVCWIVRCCLQTLTSSISTRKRRAFICSPWSWTWMFSFNLQGISFSFIVALVEFPYKPPWLRLFCVLIRAFVSWRF